MLQKPGENDVPNPIPAPGGQEDFTFKTFTLPDGATMLQKLNAITQAPQLQEHFYPLLLEHAGQQKNATGVVMLLRLAVCDFAQKLPKGNPREHQVIMTTLDMLLPSFIRILCPDPQIAQAADDFYNQTRG